MNCNTYKISKTISINCWRSFSLNSFLNQKNHYKLVVVGGGTGGLATGSKSIRQFGAGNVAIIEPSTFHCMKKSLFILFERLFDFIFKDYQPGWTLAGGGLKKPEDFTRNEADLIPKGCDWIKSKVSGFEPEENTVVLENNEKVNSIIFFIK